MIIKEESMSPFKNNSKNCSIYLINPNIS